MSASEEAFRLLGAANLPDYATRVTNAQVAAGVLKHAIDPNGLRVLLVPIFDGDEAVEDERSNVTVETGPFVENGTTARYIFVRCEDNSLVDLFSTVCDEIVEGCMTLPDQPGTVVRQVLKRWRQLLGPSRGRLLSDSELKGLLAELHLLEQLASISPSTALQRWTGSDRTRHDFSGPQLACEVKASAMVDEVRVRIHGLAQLEPPIDGRLVLFVERLEPVPVGGDSVPDVVERIVDLGIDANGLLSKLQAAGAHAADFRTYRKIRYKTLETRAYEVDSSFPRLVPSTLKGSPADGRVHSVEYVLDLAAPPPDVLSDSAWFEVTTSLVADGTP